MSGGALQLPPPFRLLACDRVGSTSDEAKRLARDGAAEGLIVCAQEQTAGRGRRGRVWASPPGNLYMSLVLRPECRAADAAQLGFVVALSLAEAVAALGPSLAVGCKWPNDLLVDGRKIAGILLETEMLAGERPDFVVIGIGVNLAASPKDVGYPATSLAEEGVAGVAPLTALTAFIRHFAPWIGRWRTAGFAPVRAAWLARAIGLGEPVRVHLHSDTLAGRFVDLDDDGALLLGLPDGRRRIAAGEVFPATAG